MGRSWGIGETMLTRHITGTSAHFIGKSHTKSSKKSVHPLLTWPTAHQNEGLSWGCWEQLAKTEAWAIGCSEPALWLRLGPAADSWLRLASGSWARLGNHYTRLKQNTIVDQPYHYPRQVLTLFSANMVCLYQDLYCIKHRMCCLSI